MNVKQIQHLLAYLGYYTIMVDGVWGPHSDEAVRRFQFDYGIDVDGEVGIVTEKALTHAIAYGMPKHDDDPVADGDWWDDIEYFTRNELRCKCGGLYCDGFPAEPKEMTVRLADRARKHFGRPAHNVSFLRCPIWNKQQGGVVDSQHQYGEAMDIRIDGVSAAELCDFFRQQPEVRYTYEINATNVHFDIPQGTR